MILEGTYICKPIFPLFQVLVLRRYMSRRKKTYFSSTLVWCIYFSFNKLWDMGLDFVLRYPWCFICCCRCCHWGYERDQGRCSICSQPCITRDWFELTYIRTRLWIWIRLLDLRTRVYVDYINQIKTVSERKYASIHARVQHMGNKSVYVRVRMHQYRVYAEQACPIVSNDLTKSIFTINAYTRSAYIYRMCTIK